MKKLSWKLLLVVALIAVLIGCMVACNKTPNEPADPPVYDEPETKPGDEGYETDAFFTELRNISRGIGNEKIGEGKNVYVEADLGLELGTKGTTTNSVKLGVAVKAVLDRSAEGKNNALSLDIKVGSKTLIGLCYTASDKMAYVTLGSQKVKVNTSLVDLGGLLGGLLDKEVATDTTVNDFIGKLTSGMSGSWTLDNLAQTIVDQFNLSTPLQTFLHGFYGGALETVLLDDGEISIEKALQHTTLQGFFNVTKAEDGEYEASVGSMLTGIVKDFLKGGKNDGVDIKLSFGAKDHKLTKPVTIAVELSPEGAETKPFANVSINHLRIREAGKKAEYTVAPQGEYKENLQLQADVDLSLTGIAIGMGSPDSKAKNTHIGLYADLDLANAENNKTALRLFINFKNNPLHDETPYDLNALDLTYKDGTLSLAVDNNAELIGVPNVLGVNYNLLLAGPIGNMIEGMVAGNATLKADFDSKYWLEGKAPTYNTATKKWEGGTSNPLFGGLRIDNVPVSSVLNMLMGSNSGATTSEEPAPEEKSGLNIFKTLTAVLSLISTDNAGNLTVGCESVLDLITEITGLDETGFKGMLNGVSIIGTLYNYLYVNGVPEGIIGNPYVADVLVAFLDSPLSLKLGLGENGINLNLGLIMNKPEDESFENHGSYIEANATIKFNATKQEIVCSDNAQARLAAATKAYEDAQAAKDAAETAKNTAETAYKATSEYQAWETANSKWTNAEKTGTKDAYDAAYADFKALPGVGLAFVATSVAGAANGYVGQSKAYYNWVKAGKPTDENNATLKAKDAALKAVTDAIEAVADPTQKAAIQKAWDELKVKGEKACEDQWEASQKETAYKATTAYNTYDTKNREYNTANKACTAAQNFKANEEKTVNQYWIRWDFAPEA